METSRTSTATTPSTLVKQLRYHPAFLTGDWRLMTASADALRNTDTIAGNGKGSYGRFVAGAGGTAPWLVAGRIAALE